MRFCSNCNAAINEGENYCSNCGARVEEELNEYNDGYIDDDFSEEPIDFSAVHNFKSDDDNNIYSHSQHSTETPKEAAPLQAPETKQPQSKEEPYIKKVCPNCNQPLNRGQSVCPYCGYDVSRYNDGYDSPIVDEYTPAPSPFAYPQANKSKKKNGGKTAVIVTSIIAAVAVIAAVIVVFAFFGNRSNSTNPTEPTSDTAVTETQSETETETEEPTPEQTQPETEEPTPEPTEPETQPETEPETEAPTVPETEAPTQPQTEETQPLEPQPEL